MNETITRRSLLITGAAFAAAQTMQAQFFRKHTPKPAPGFVYIGCDTSKGVAKGIYLCRFDAATGHLSTPVLAAPSLRPAYFAFGPVHNGRRMVYVGNEGPDAASSTITTYAVDPVTGMLRQLAQVSSGASGPAYVSVDATGKSAYVADYAGSAVAAYGIKSDGLLTPPVEVLNYKKDDRFGPVGPQADRQDAPHPHCATISPDNRFVVVCDLGTDKISIFAIHPETGKLGEPTFFQCDPGTGPRHVAFHPNGRWVYGIDELSNKIDQYLWTATHGAEPKAMLVDTKRSVATLAEGYSGGTNTAAEVVVSPNGFYLYASNRGENTLVVFAIDQESGAPSVVQRIGCGGKGPRQFTLDPTGRWLLCGNQLSASVTVFARDPTSGKLTGPVQTLAIDSPMFTCFG
ncbi:6-phosphogluconolactonase [Granulicella rosea]|uniref:6-phosphogluconolactonase n=1 Tax=Granulicella rosea TaxID=474952 RepID=A0A239KMA1_9BACT|nr:lactonase family protein [Granulicella rosea]SNT18852.1 6-phosphogluconolactonase [Granulicella rosea]